LSVRVTLVRGRCRVVLVVGPSSSSSERVVVRRGEDVSLLSEVVEEGGFMSVVSGGLVLVMVWVVVEEAAADSRSVAEYVGATKSSGAGSVSPNWRATAVAATIRMLITKIARTLAPTTVDVRLCHGCRSSSS
jgi:hypothetical protein